MNLPGLLLLALGTPRHLIYCNTRVQAPWRIWDFSVRVNFMTRLAPPASERFELLHTLPLIGEGRDRPNGTKRKSSRSARAGTRWFTCRSFFCAQ